MKELEKLQKAKENLEQYIREEDRDNAAEAIAELLAAQVQVDTESVEISIPTRCVLDTIDLGAVSLKRTTQGILFEAKGGLVSLVRPTLVGTYGTLSEIFDLIKTDFADIADKDVRSDLESLVQCWLYVMQAPLFASVGPELVADMATLMITSLRKRMEEMEKEPLQPENPKEDAAFENFIKATSDDNI